MAEPKKSEAEVPLNPMARRDRPDPASAGQSGDLQGLSDTAEAESESVTELLEEGNAFEAAVVSGVENAPPADATELKTKEVPEDDVPLEYLEQEREQPKE